jgi:hypothetical protein
MARCRRPDQRDGTVATGAAAGWPVSAREKSSIRKVKVRLLAMSVSSIQYQWSLNCTAAYVSDAALDAADACAVDAKSGPDSELGLALARVRDLLGQKQPAGVDGPLAG